MKVLYHRRGMLEPHLNLSAAIASPRSPQGRLATCRGGRADGAHESPAFAFGQQAPSQSPRLTSTGSSLPSQNHGRHSAQRTWTSRTAWRWPPRTSKSPQRPSPLAPSPRSPRTRVAHGAAGPNTATPSQYRWGALYAVETLLQLVQYNHTLRLHYFPAAPFTIDDRPRFPWRGTKGRASQRIACCTPPSPCSSPFVVV
jgi:hypothetical protein